MRQTPPHQIKRHLRRQAEGEHGIASYCVEHGLKAPTFYSWKRKYANLAETFPVGGFCEIKPTREDVATARGLRLPSGLSVDLIGLSIGEIAELILEIDRAHA